MTKRTTYTSIFSPYMNEFRELEKPFTSQMRDFIKRPGRDPRERPESNAAALRKAKAEGSDFQDRAAVAGVEKLLSAQALDTDFLGVLLRAVGRSDSTASPDYAALRALHGMTWADMGCELAQQAREAALELLGMPISIACMVDVERPAGAPSRPAKWLSLAFWRPR